MTRYITVFALTALLTISSSATLISEGLAVGAYSASGQYLGYAPEQAFDGAAGTNWNAGGFSMQWIEVDLGQTFEVAAFNLSVEQAPAGNTIHEIWLSLSAMHANLGSATLVHTFNAFTSNDEILLAALSAPVTAQYVQVRTVSSPSWVAWNEVQVFAANTVPEPATLGLLGFGLAGLGLARRRKV